MSKTDLIVIYRGGYTPDHGRAPTISSNMVDIYPEQLFIFVYANYIQITYSGYRINILFALTLLSPINLCYKYIFNVKVKSPD